MFAYRCCPKVKKSPSKLKAIIDMKGGKGWESGFLLYHLILAPSTALYIHLHDNTGKDKCFCIPTCHTSVEFKQ